MYHRIKSAPELVCDSESIQDIGKFAGPRDYIATLDGWRAIAIIGVMLAHSDRSILAMSGRFSQKIADISYTYGGYGVDIFFALSGFLICSRLLQFKDRTGNWDLKGFYWRRCWRILPPYYAYLLFAALAQSIFEFRVPQGDWLASILFYRNLTGTPPLHTHGWWVTAHFWSIAVEEHFYLLLPLTLLICKRERARWALPVMAFVFAIWRSADIKFNISGSDFTDVWTYHRTDHMMDKLMWGAAIAPYWVDDAMRPHLKRLFTPAVTVLIVALTPVLVVEQLKYQELWLPIAITIAITGTALNSKTIIARLLETRLLRQIGRLSYSLYIWQQFFLVDAGITVATKLKIVYRFPFNYILIISAALISYYCIEQPAIKFGRRIATNRRARAMALNPGLNTG